GKGLAPLPPKGDPATLIGVKFLLLTTLAALAAPAAAFGADPTMVARDVPLHGGARLLTAAAPQFNMVRVHWRGPGGAQLRWRTASGTWSAWQTADDDIAPDAKSAENRDPGWRLGSPIWTGTDAHAIRFRMLGRVTALRAYYIWTPTEKKPARRIAIANQ